MAAEIQDGAVLVARGILNSSLWTMRPEDCKLAMTCIAIANWKDRKIWDGKTEKIVMRGQFIRSLTQLAEASRLTIQSTRTSAKHLILTGFLTRELTGLSYLYTIPKYDRYQTLANYSDSAINGANTNINTVANSRLTGDQQASNRDLTGDQQGPNNKQEREEGDKGEEGKESLTLECAPNFRSGSPGHLLANWYRQHNPGVYGPQLAADKFNFYLSRSMPFPDCEKLVSNPSSCKGKTIDELCKPICPSQNNGHSIDLELKKWAKLNGVPYDP